MRQHSLFQVQVNLELVGDKMIISDFGQSNAYLGTLCNREVDAQLVRKRRNCPSCGQRAARTKDLCRNCTGKRTSRAKEFKTCPICNHKGKRLVEICFKCQVKREGTIKVCLTCGHSGYRKTEMCCKCLGKAGLSPARRKNPVWNPEMTEFLVKYYPENGAAWIAEKLGVEHSSVYGKAKRLKINLTKEATRRIVHDAAAKHMKLHNPAKTPKNREKSRQRVKDPKHIAKFLEAHAKICKENPTNLEIRLCQILDFFGIKYEHQCVIKPKFIVDIKIGNLVIEADGDWWHGHPRFEPLRERQLKQQTRDIARDKYLLTCGYKVERVWESDLSPELVKSILQRHNLL